MSNNTKIIFLKTDLIKIASSLGVYLVFCFCVTAALANPNGEQVVSGQATFVRNDNTLTVTNSPSAIINWQNFSINNNEAVRFAQQNSASSVLNRITGQSPSTILGTLSSNGRVFLVNPNGIFFGQNARIDVNGLVASTLNISNQDFLAGKYNFAAGMKAGDIKNQGTIRTPEGGQVYLIAPDVENTGIINTPKGEVFLAAGRSVQLLDSLDPDITVVVSAPGDAAVNLGKIVADSGKVGIFGSLVMQKGIVSADSAVAGENGKIIFKATEKLTVASDSVTSAKSTKGTGGEIRLLAREVELLDNALVDVSGLMGGGTALIGGDYQGKNPAIPNARTTFVARGVSLKADAITSGDGGKVVLWADGTTSFYGSISARGGATGGNGGSVEVSGKETLVYRGMTNLTAGHGRTGSLLLDPTDYTIAASGGDLTGANLAALLAMANVTIQTGDTGGQAGDIKVNDAVTWNSATTLALKAVNNIDVNNEIANNAGGSLILRADSDGDGAGTVAFAGSGSVTLTGGGTASLYYNPSSYTSPTDYTGYFSGVTPTEYMLINTLDQLQNMNTNLSGTYALGKDIDASATVGWNGGQGFNPIGHAVGDADQGYGVLNDLSALTFDGNGHTISNLYINRPNDQYVGMFGGVGGPTIRNAWLSDVNVTGKYQVGGLIAHFGPNGGINVANSFVTGTVTSSSIVTGGLVGLSAGVISNSYSKATVNGNGNSWVGGLVGCNWGTDARVIDSYSTGSVYGSGGLVGGNYNTVASPVSGSYWNTVTSGVGGSAGGTGKNTSEMMSPATYAGWDFTNTWGMVEGSSYPYLFIPSLGGLTLTPGYVALTPTNPSPSSPMTLSPNIAIQIASRNTVDALANLRNNVNPNSIAGGIPHYSSGDEYMRDHPSMVITTWAGDHVFHYSTGDEFMNQYLSMVVATWAGNNVVHYATGEDYMNAHPVMTITGLENLRHYDTLTDYVKDNPWFITGVSMNKSPQLDAEGNFIDGLLGPLDYLTTAGSGGMGFADLEQGGEYGGYTGARLPEPTDYITDEDRRLAEAINAGAKVPLHFVHDQNASGEESSEPNTEDLEFDHYDADGMAIYKKGDGSYVNSSGQATDAKGHVLQIAENTDQGEDVTDVTDQSSDSAERISDGGTDRSRDADRTDHGGGTDADSGGTVEGTTSTDADQISKLNRQKEKDPIQYYDNLLKQFQNSSKGGDNPKLTDYEIKQLMDAGLIKSADPRVNAKIVEDDTYRDKVGTVSYLNGLLEQFKNSAKGGEDNPKLTNYETQQLLNAGLIKSADPRLNAKIVEDDAYREKVGTVSYLNGLLEQFQNSAKDSESPRLTDYETKQLLDAGLIKSADPRVNAKIVEDDAYRDKVGTVSYLNGLLEQFKNSAKGSAEDVPRLTDYETKQLMDAGLIKSVDPRLNAKIVEDDAYREKVGTVSYLNGLLQQFKNSTKGSAEDAPRLTDYETKQLLDAGLIKSADPRVNAKIVEDDAYRDKVGTVSYLNGLLQQFKNSAKGSAEDSPRLTDYETQQLLDAGLIKSDNPYEDARIAQNLELSGVKTKDLGYYEGALTAFNNGETVPQEDLNYLKSIGAIKSTNAKENAKLVRQQSTAENKDLVYYQNALTAFNNGESVPQEDLNYLKSLGAIQSTNAKENAKLVKQQSAAESKGLGYYQGALQTFNDGGYVPPEDLNYLKSIGAIQSTNAKENAQLVQQQTATESKDLGYYQGALQTFNDGGYVPPEDLNYLKSIGAIMSTNAKENAKLVQQETAAENKGLGYYQGALQTFNDGGYVPPEDLNYLKSIGAIQSTNAKQNAKLVQQSKIDKSPGYYRNAVDSFNAGKTIKQEDFNYLMKIGAIRPKARP